MFLYSGLNYITSTFFDWNENISVNDLPPRSCCRKGDHNIELVGIYLSIYPSIYLSIYLYIYTVNLRVLVEKFTPRIVYVKSGVDFYAQTDIKRCRLEIGIPDVSYSQFPSVFQRSKLLQNPPSC